MILYAIYPSPVGTLQIGFTDRAILSLCKADKPAVAHTPSPLSDLAAEQVRAYLAGERRDFDFPYELIGTEFQKKVWSALCAIPYGETRSYKQIAEAIGNPKASRAVGMANNNNPLMLVVPCHRVVGAKGKLVGYAGGLDMKEALLALEGKHAAK